MLNWVRASRRSVGRNRREAGKAVEGFWSGGREMPETLDELELRLKKLVDTYRTFAEEHKARMEQTRLDLAKARRILHDIRVLFIKSFVLARIFNNAQEGGIWSAHFQGQEEPKRGATHSKDAADYRKAV